MSKRSRATPWFRSSDKYLEHLHKLYFMYAGNLQALVDAIMEDKVAETWHELQRRTWTGKRRIDR